MMFQNLYNTRTTQYEEELRKTYSDLEDTEIADKYVDLIKQYKQAKDNYDKMGLIVDEARMKDLEKQLDVMENIIRRSSKTSDVLLDLFADSSKDQKLSDDILMHINSVYSEKANKEDASKFGRFLETFPALIKEA
nr:MAG TPA: hypothetical protein [Caudoviricetes sp.]